MSIVQLLIPLYYSLFRLHLDIQLILIIFCPTTYKNQIAIDAFQKERETVNSCYTCIQIKKC
jgi:hypothetical protein